MSEIEHRAIGWRTAARRRQVTRRASRGITYLWTLIAVALIGVGLAALGQVWHTTVQREKERELLFAGEQIQRAIGMYYESTPAAGPRYPRKLEDLLRDERYPNIRRYLRKVYADPMTGKKQWGIIEQPGIGILGVYSLSELKPINKVNFPERFRQFESAVKYSDWKFVYIPGQAIVQPSVPQAPAARTLPPPR